MSLTGWYEQRLAKAMAHVEELEEAISGLLDGSIQTYQLDSGNTRTLVSKQQMSPMYLALQRAEARVSALEARVCGASSRILPDW